MSYPPYDFLSAQRARLRWFPGRIVNISLKRALKLRKESAL
jgi:hypothetical protein